MSTNTIELPEDLAEQIRNAADAEGQDFNNYAVARLKDIFSGSNGEQDDDLLECLRQGIADDDAGRTISLEDLDAHVYGLLANKAA